MRKEPGDEAFRVSFKLPRRKWDQRLADFNLFSSIETRSRYSSLVLYLHGLSEGYLVAKYKKFPGGIVFCVRFAKVSGFFTSAHTHVWHGICYWEKSSKFSPVWKISFRAEKLHMISNFFNSFNRVEIFSLGWRYPHNQPFKEYFLSSLFDKVKIMGAKYF